MEGGHRIDLVSVAPGCGACCGCTRHCSKPVSSPALTGFCWDGVEVEAGLLTHWENQVFHRLRCTNCNRLASLESGYGVFSPSDTQNGLQITLL